MRKTLKQLTRLTKPKQAKPPKPPKQPRTKIASRWGKLNFSEQFYPARPSQLWKKARSLAKQPIYASQKLGSASALNVAYVRWLTKESMLHDANTLATKYSGKSRMWQHPYAKPRPRTAVRLASVWYTTYPASLITKDRQSILASLADEELWQAFQDIGIEALHTGPMKEAGGLDGWKETPSIDGHFDRITTQIDELYGTEDEFRAMAETAAAHNGIIIDDIVPGHTGKGADFRLAEMAHGDYPGIYHMVEIDPKDWPLLPKVRKGEDAANINAETEEALKKRGYIIGKLHRVMFYEPGVKETNWSATKEIRGVDGIKRRWVYLHYFKAGQPSINWLDPSFAGMKLVIGDALHSLGELGTRALRLDANGFLGIEKVDEDEPAWSEGHPLSEAANLLISGMVRKMGGFTFQEVNLSLDDIKAMAEAGADLSYDFVNRPAYHYALAIADTEFLRLMMRTGRDLGIDPASLVHAMQNHDELTYELVHFWTIHKDDTYTLDGRTMTGFELRKKIRQDLLDTLTGEAAPYNLPFTGNGIACTSVSVITAVLGYKDVTQLTQADIAQIQRVHLLLAMFNALQPGVFALSGWDLAGSLTLPIEKVRDLVADGDTRWINRGAYDLLGINPLAEQSDAGMPLANNLYGTLPEQLANDNSFVSQLRRILAVRKQYGIATSHQVDIPDVSHKSMLVLVHKLNTENQYQVTVLNFSNELITGSVSSKQLPAAAKVTDMFTGQPFGSVDNLHTFPVSLHPYQGLSLLIEA